MVICIVGPTAVGKTDLSIYLAKIYNGEIINADSTQVYKGMDIGTAKITEKEKSGVKHHLFDIVDVEENYTVYDYQRDCRVKIEEIKARNHIPIIVGGTGLYIKAALYNYDFVDTDNLDYIDNLEVEEIKKQIREIDDNIDIDYQNPRRLISTLKNLLSGYTQKLDKDHLLYDTVFIGLTTNREELYKRINMRFNKMLIPLVDEVKSFYQKGIRSKALNTAIGYKELYEFFDNKKTFKEVVEECKQNTRNYAKRQYTWFNNQMDIKWFDVDFDDFSKTIEEVTKYLESNINLLN